MSLLVVVPCGRAKIWKKYPHRGPTKAKDAYIGSPFKVNKVFAETFADRWVVLSAKYGFLDPDDRIEDYEVTFKRRSTHPIDTTTLRTQVREKQLDTYGTVIVLGGFDYTRIVQEVFVNRSAVFTPTRGLPIGKAMQRVKALSSMTKPAMVERVRAVE